MSSLELFPPDKIIGIFRGFCEGGLEFHADLVLPYRTEFQRMPMHGQFLLIRLETADEAILGRISSCSSEGKLTSSYGEEFSLRVVRENREISDDLRSDYLKYRINIRVLGVVRNTNDTITFVASHRRLPHVGSPVAFPSDQVLQEIVGHAAEGAAIGHFALGEFIYAADQQYALTADWMHVVSPEVLVKFPVESLVARRSFIFARAGFGKSNLNKLLFSKLYAETPVTTKRGGRKVPVGTIIFDPDGEYFWPDDKGRPGLCDVPELQDKIVVFTPRKGPSEFYSSFIAGGIKLDIRRLSPSDVTSIALNQERQEQQNVRKLKNLNQRNWTRLVDLIEQGSNQASLDEISTLLGLESKQDVEAMAARANMTSIVHMLHDKSSQFLDMLIYALKEGKLCIVDISQMRGQQGLILSGLLLRRIFEHNQQQFTAAEPETIPTLAVIEEAQSVLNERATAAEPYIAWVKEGRKYDLGALLITQQPGSIPHDILSQGDNWFLFHLLSSTDLVNVQRANAHFSTDILSTLLNEPIPGQGIFWSSVGGKAYPIPLRVLSFEHLYSALDPQYDKVATETFAQVLKEKFAIPQQLSLTHEEELPLDDDFALSETSDQVDVLAVHKQNAIEALKNDTSIMKQLQGRGVPWGVLTRELEAKLPITLENRHDIAYYFVAEALEHIFGKRNEGWHVYKAGNNAKMTTFVKAGKKV